MDHSSSSILPLETLRAFEAAARGGSFTAAAERLNITHGAVSRQIAKLEGWLGLRLFDRGARGVTLTSDGQRLFARTSEAFALIADTSDRWRKPRGPAVVRVSSVPSVSGLWLMPRLTRLERGDPSLRIVLNVDHRHADLEDEGTDLAIRCGRGAFPGRKSQKLFEEMCYPIASADVAAAIGTGAPERLLKYPVIHDSDASAWRAWFAAHAIDYHPRPQDRRFEDYNLVLDAAIYGLGIALARPPLVKDLLQTGRLAPVDDATVLNPVSYWLDRPEREPRPAAAVLAHRIGREAGLPSGQIDRFLAES